MTDSQQGHTHVEAFTFGEAEPIRTAYDLVNTGLWAMGGLWYEPPFDYRLLSKCYRATPHHGSALQVKRNILVRSFIPHPLLSRQQFTALALDFLTFGNAYLHPIYSRLGNLMALDVPRAKYVRRGLDLETYYWVPLYGQEEAFTTPPWHLMQPGIDQEVYGEPDYIGALDSIQLNKEATTFRLRYYRNGSHAGFLLYTTGDKIDPIDQDFLRQAMKDSKGPGNFRNFYMHITDGSKDSVNLIPISEIAAKDDFQAIKGQTRDDQLAAHRVPPQLMGIIPNNTGGFGDIEKAAAVFVANELEPLQETLSEFNDMIGQEVIRFAPFSLSQPRS
ncbi:phage portal protein [Zymobacter sp. IVIA_5232.4 C2]|uniref:phage portal protein n=1 Tax=Zymobacter sp. IVIA_5232.4 C2 TaxID=3394855 RepID=UPI0039C2A631